MLRPVHTEPGGFAAAQELAQSVIAARLDRIRGRYDPNRGFPFGPP